jgi:hypothetical protein
MNMEQWWNDIDRENRRTRRKTCPSATLSTTNPTWIDPGANPVLRGKRPAINRLSHDTGPTTRIITYYTEASLHRLALSRAEVRFLTKQTFVLTRTLSFCFAVRLLAAAETSINWFGFGREEFCWTRTHLSVFPIPISGQTCNRRF